jgi:hypothetical protein
MKKITFTSVVQAISRGLKSFYKGLQELASACPSQTRWNA